MDELGQINTDGETRTLRFRRRFSAGPEQVWAALSEPARLGDWLTDATVEPQSGGAIELDFGENGVCRGTIGVWDPPRTLEYGWRFPDGHDSTVRWELEARGDGTTEVTLVHSLLRSTDAPGYGAGWHAFLDRLAGHLGGETADWGERFAALRPRYEELVNG